MEEILTEGQIIVKLREALEILKEKFTDEAGCWSTLDFLEAAQNKNHWMHKIVEAERLSEPFMAKTDARP